MTVAAAPILAKLRDLPRQKPGRNGWTNCCCPAHEDAKPSLGYIEHDDHSIGLHCQAGCPSEAIVDALGVTMKDLYPASTNGHANGAIITAKPKAGPRVGTIRHVSIDIAGREWTHVRPVDADGRKVGGPFWEPAGVALAELRPYGSELVAGRSGSDPVFVVEGEATAAALRGQGLAAVATFGASYRPAPEALAPLAGCNVVLWPDADTAGRAHMLDMAHRLDGIASAVRW